MRSRDDQQITNRKTDATAGGGGGGGTSYDSNRHQLTIAVHPNESISAADNEAMADSPTKQQAHESKGDDFQGSCDNPPGARRPSNSSFASSKSSPQPFGITKTGLRVLLLLTVQVCSKNILLRFVMKEKPRFLTSVAVIGIELVKVTTSLLYIRLVLGRPLSSAATYLKQDKNNTLLMCVPAALYSVQMNLEYVALRYLDAAVFSVLVQTKLLATAACAVMIMKKRLKKAQLISLVLLTLGVMLCNIKTCNDQASQGRRLTEQQPPLNFTEPGHDLEHENGYEQAIFSAISDTNKGILATLGISACSAFASVYTEKVIKAKRDIPSKMQPIDSSSQHSKKQSSQQYGLAYNQIQLSFACLMIMGTYCLITEINTILERGLFYGFNVAAFVSIFVGAIGGLLVAAVLKFADAVLKGYAGAISVVVTGILSKILFGTQLNLLYFIGVGNVICAVLLYSANDLDHLLC